MFQRALHSLLVAAVVLVATVGCFPPAPEPAEPAPRFTSEADAFAAAEETYRAYVDALNQVDLSDPETFEAVFAWTTGEASADDRTTFSQMHANGWRVEGTSSFDGFRPTSFVSRPPASVTAELCINVTDIKVLNQAGASVVPDGRLDRQPVVVTFLENSLTRTSLAIDASTAMDNAQCD